MTAVPTKRDMLWMACKQFIEDQRITCPETISQSDRVIINAYEFIEDICDIVGYAKSDWDDDD